MQYLVTDLTAKRLEILKEILPKLSRVVTFYNPGDLIAPAAAKLAREEAGRLGIKFIERHVGFVEELRKVLQALKPGEADAYFYVPDVVVIGQVQLIIDTQRRSWRRCSRSKVSSPKGRSPATGRTSMRSAAYRLSTLSAFFPASHRVT